MMAMFKSSATSILVDVIALSLVVRKRLQRELHCRLDGCPEGEVERERERHCGVRHNGAFMRHRARVAHY